MFPFVGSYVWNSRAATTSLYLLKSIYHWLPKSNIFPCVRTPENKIWHNFKISFWIIWVNPFGLYVKKTQNLFVWCDTSYASMSFFTGCSTMQLFRWHQGGTNTQYRTENLLLDNCILFLPKCKYHAIIPGGGKHS